MPPDTPQSWMERLSSGELDIAELPTPQELLLQLGENDPRLRGLMRYMTLRQQVAEAESEPAEPEAPEPEPPARPSTRRMLHDLTVQLETLRERNDLLAAALGACYLCWGEEPDCAECHGRGHPGSRRPDAALFAEWIGPAVRRLQRGPARGARMPPTAGAL
jgi:hypothetical protein